MVGTVGMLDHIPVTSRVVEIRLLDSESNVHVKGTFSPVQMIHVILSLSPGIPTLMRPNSSLAVAEVFSLVISLSDIDGAFCWCSIKVENLSPDNVYRCFDVLDGDVPRNSSDSILQSRPHQQVSLL
jgi:hypothetical protein